MCDHCLLHVCGKRSVLKFILVWLFFWGLLSTDLRTHNNRIATKNILEYDFETSACIVFDFVIVIMTCKKETQKKPKSVIINDCRQQLTLWKKCFYSGCKLVVRDQKEVTWI